MPPAPKLERTMVCLLVHDTNVSVNHPRWCIPRTISMMNLKETACTCSSSGMIFPLGSFSRRRPLSAPWNLWAIPRTESSGRHGSFLHILSLSLVPARPSWLFAACKHAREDSSFVLDAPEGSFISPHSSLDLKFKSFPCFDGMFFIRVREPPDSVLEGLRPPRRRLLAAYIDPSMSPVICHQARRFLSTVVLRFFFPFDIRWLPPPRTNKSIAVVSGTSCLDHEPGIDVARRTSHIHVGRSCCASMVQRTLLLSPETCAVSQCGRSNVLMSRAVCFHPVTSILFLTCVARRVSTPFRDIFLVTSRF